MTTTRSIYNFLNYVYIEQKEYYAFSDYFNKRKQEENYFSHQDKCSQKRYKKITLHYQKQKAIPHTLWEITQCIYSKNIFLLNLTPSLFIRVFVIFGARALGLSFGSRVSGLRGSCLYFFLDFTLILLWFFSCTSSQEINLLSMGSHRKTVLLERSIIKFVFGSKIFAIENKA